jgi:hypothetical protein
MLVGIIGSLFFAFVPEAGTQDIAKYISFALYPYIVTIGVVMFLRVRAKAAHRIKFFKSNIKFYLYVFALYPVCAAFIGYSNYLALSIGYPYLYTSLVSDSEIIETQIINKRLWGKRDRNEEVTILGFTEGFPVSRSYYNRVKVNQKVKIGVSKSVFGTSIEFKMP